PCGSELARDDGSRITTLPQIAKLKTSTQFLTSIPDTCAIKSRKPTKKQNFSQFFPTACDPPLTRLGLKP
ncbi:hypothetical protein, partial [Pseudomonas sp. N8]|uniref:hypothetical protein n=1 Tax=Pseudomonas sp. N8 TaxID=3449428 RepID=UPI003F6982D1